MIFNYKMCFLLLQLIFLCSCANSLFYHPDKKSYESPSKYKQDYKDVYFKSGSTRLHGWFIPAKDPAKAAGTIIHFHGNAQNLSAHYDFVRWAPELNFNLFLFDYRGYGKSGGHPSMRGIQKDGMAALKYIAKHPSVNPDKLYVIAQSLGTAIAVSALAELNGSVPVQRLVLDSAFYSYEAIAAYHLGNRKFSKCLATCLITDRYSPHKHIAGLSPLPILFLHGHQDDISPYPFGRKLYKYAGEPKEFVSMPGAHTSAFQQFSAASIQRVLQFFETDYSILEPKKKQTDKED